MRFVSRCILLFFFANSLLASTSHKQSYKIQHFRFQGSPAIGDVAELKLQFKSFINGGTSITLVLPQGMRLQGEDEKVRSSTQKENVLQNTIIAKTWYVLIEKEADYLVQAFISSDSTKPGYIQTSAEQLYISFKKGKITYHDNIIPFHHSLIIPDSTERDKKRMPEVFPRPTSSIQNQPSSANVLQSTATDLWVYVAGKVRYQDYDRISGSTILRGVPNVRVDLDFDYDNNGSTGYLPWGGNIRHASYDITDDEGNYYFYVRFINAQPAYTYASQIRVTAGKGNETMYFRFQGIGARFSDNESFVGPLNESNAWYVSYPEAHLNVNSFEGSCLRYLHRVRMVTMEKFGYDPPTARVQFDGSGKTFFQSQNDEAGWFPFGYQEYPHIHFGHNPVPDWIGYHEYAHHAHYAVLGSSRWPPQSEGEHWLTKKTNIDAAFKEGWAEFHQAVTKTHYWKIEGITSFDPLRDIETPAYYEFPEQAQRFLFPDREPTEVEGAILCYLYNLYDDTQQRLAGYTGDNDDVNGLGNKLWQALTKG